MFPYFLDSYPLCFGLHGVVIEADHYEMTEARTPEFSAHLPVPHWEGGEARGTFKFNVLTLGLYHVKRGGIETKEKSG